MAPRRIWWTRWLPCVGAGQTIPKRERAGVALVNRPNLLHSYRQLTNCEAKRRAEVKKDIITI
jgi:hypothetical protein